MHIDLLTPLLSTMDRLWPRLNVQSVVGNRTLVQRRGVTPSARSSRAPFLLLPHTPRTGCLQRLPLAERGAQSRTTNVSFRFVFRIVSRFQLHHMRVPNPTYVLVRCLPWPHQSVGVCIPHSRGLQRGGENCEPLILNSTGRLTPVWRVPTTNGVGSGEVPLPALHSAHQQGPNGGSRG